MSARADRRLTVLLVVPTLDAGAADDGVIAHARVLAAAGHRPVVVARGGRREAEAVAAGAAFIRCDVASRNPLRMLRNAARLALVARRERCDIVHAHGRAAAWSAYVAARAARLPFLTTWYKGFREQNFAKRLYNSVMVRGDRVIVVSEQLGELVRHRHGTPRERLVVIPRLIDLSGFDPGAVAPERIAAMRQAWGAASEARIVLVVGRMLRRKGHHVVVQAMQRLKERGVKDVLCVLIGEDPGHSRYVGELWDLILATGTSDIVRLAGPAADLPAAYAAAAVVVSAALQPEGMQRAVLEAQAMACPVIVSDLGAGSDLVRAPPAVSADRMTGLRIPAGDPGELAAALVRMLSLPDAARRAVGARGRALALAQFGDETAAAPLLRLYAELARARNRRGRSG